MSHPSDSCSNFLWLDRLGVGMALICAVHCLLTPVLIVLLPIIASSFWVDSEFHLWMLLMVVPLTTFPFLWVVKSTMILFWWFWLFWVSLSYSLGCGSVVQPVLVVIIFPHLMTYQTFLMVLSLFSQH